MVNGFLGGQNLDVSWVFGSLMVGRYNNPKEVFGGVETTKVTTFPSIKMVEFYGFCNPMQKKVAWACGLVDANFQGFKTQLVNPTLILIINPTQGTLQRMQVR